MEIIRSSQGIRIASVLFDFDGTISTLRCGWENVMEPLLAEVLQPYWREDAAALERMVKAYVNESTGIQTIFQMKWLAEQVTALGGQALDPWDYKDEYNRRLMLEIEKKKQRLQSGQDQPQSYLMAGSVAFLQALKQRGVQIYVASGTDHPDVVQEAKALGVYDFFDELAGAPVREESCSKEAVLRRLIHDHHLAGSQVAVIGDGKVEIALGKQAGALALGLASDEYARCGVNPVKRERLLRAGADVIIGDYTGLDAILHLMGLQ